MPIHPFQGVTPRIHPTAFIHPGAVVIGDVEIGPHSSLWPGVVVRGDVNAIRIGARTNIQDGSVLHVSRPTAANPGGNPLVIGDDVTVGHRVVLHGCRLERGCMVGMGAVVMDGVVVGEEALVAAGALVPPHKEVAAGDLWAGVPAKRLRPMSPDERSAQLATGANYVQLAQLHARSG